MDAIEFALTGEISRLTGKGTGGLTLATHGPRVDRRDYPDSSFVHLKLFIPELDKSVTITRHINKPKQATITPEDDDVKGILAEIAQHPFVIDDETREFFNDWCESLAESLWEAGPPAPE